MVVCLRLEIDEAFESDLKTLDYIVYQGREKVFIHEIFMFERIHLADSYKVETRSISNTSEKDSSSIRTASIGQRYTRELLIETYSLDGSIMTKYAFI